MNCVRGVWLSTPLFEAAYNGRKEAVKVLLDKGADPTKADECVRWTPLHVAALWGRKDVVQLPLSLSILPIFKLLYYILLV